MQYQSFPLSLNFILEKKKQFFILEKKKQFLSCIDVSEGAAKTESYFSVTS